MHSNRENYGRHFRYDTDIVREDRSRSNISSKILLLLNYSLKNPDAFNFIFNFFHGSLVKKAIPADHIFLHCSNSIASISVAITRVIATNHGLYVLSPFFDPLFSFIKYPHLSLTFFGIVTILFYIFLL